MKRLAIVKGVCLFLFFAAACKKKQADDTPSLPADQSSFASAAIINQRLGRGVNLGDTYESSWAARESNPVIFAEWQK